MTGRMGYSPLIEQAIISDWEDGVQYSPLIEQAIISDWEDGVLSPDRTDHEVSKGNNQ